MGEVPLYPRLYFRLYLADLQRLAAWTSTVIFLVYRGTSLIRNSAPLGPQSRTMPRALW